MYYCPYESVLVCFFSGQKIVTENNHKSFDNKNLCWNPKFQDVYCIFRQDSSN